MAVSKYALLEARVAVIEIRLAALEERVATMEANSIPPKRPLVDVVWGSFENDVAFEKAMELGRKYREAQRPKPVKRKARKSAKKPQPVKGR